MAAATPRNVDDQSLLNEISLIGAPWVESLIPILRKKAPLLATKSSLRTLRLFHDEHEGPLPPQPPASSTSPESPIDSLEFRRRTLLCQHAFSELGYPPPPRSDFTPQEEFVAIGLQYLLPHNSHSPQQALRLLSELAARYFDNPYHNARHAGQVAHHTVYLARIIGIYQHLHPLDKKALILAALGHDIGHPGKSNLFFRKTGHPLALLYCDKHILEQYHAVSLLQVLQRDECNVFQGATMGQLTAVRRTILHLVLSTDMADHYSVMSKARAQFKETVAKAKNPQQIIESNEMRREILAICLKAGDVAYMAAGHPQHMLQQIVDYFEEVFIQRALEANLDIPPSDPMTYLDLGSQQWYERNAVFGSTVVMPMGQFLSDVERKLRSGHGEEGDVDSEELARVQSRSAQRIQPWSASPAKSTTSQAPRTPRMPNRSSSSVGDVDIGELEGFGTIEPQLGWLQSLDCRNLTELADRLSSMENKLDRTALVKPQKGQNGEKWAWAKITKSPGSLWAGKATKTKTTTIYRVFLKPLERNIRALRHGRFFAERQA